MLELIPSYLDYLVRVLFATVIDKLRPDRYQEYR